MTGQRRAVGLLLDEMFSGKLAEQLRMLGLDVVAVVEIPGLSGSSDEVVLELATAQRRVLVTKNIADFNPLSQEWAASNRDHQAASREVV